MPVVSYQFVHALQRLQGKVSADTAERRLISKIQLKASTAYL